MSEKLSKKEKFREKKRKEKLKKNLVSLGIIILVSGIFLFWMFSSIEESPSYDSLNVSSDEVPGEQIHWHPRLSIIIEGEEITIPNNIGIGPGVHHPTHTHDEGDGTIHLENMNPKEQPETMALGYFFNIWGEPFNESCILDKCTTQSEGELTMYVDGEENYQYEKFIFKGEEEIVIEYTS